MKENTINIYFPTTQLGMWTIGLSKSSVKVQQFLQIASRYTIDSCVKNLLKLSHFIESRWLSRRTGGAEGSLTVWRAAQHVEAEACLTADLQWQDADVQCRHGRPEQLHLRVVSVRRAWQRLETKKTQLKVSSPSFDGVKNKPGSTAHSPPRRLCSRSRRLRPCCAGS